MTGRVEFSAHDRESSARVAALTHSGTLMPSPPPGSIEAVMTAHKTAPTLRRTSGHDSNAGRANPFANVAQVERLEGDRTVEQILATALRRSILNGSLAPGLRLPYRDIAEHFGVSVTPVRIALKELSSEGLVQMRPHSGARVTPLSGEEIEEIMLTRAAIEPWLALHGAPNLDAQALEQMKQLLTELHASAAIADRPLYLETTWKFKDVCYGAAGRPRLLARVASLYDLSTRYHFLSLADASRMMRSAVYMDDFVAACERKNGTRAATVMRESIEWTLDYLAESAAGWA